MVNHHALGLAYAGTGVSLLGALNAGDISAWGGALAALVALLWTLVRDQHDRDLAAARHRELLTAVAKARCSAIAAGKPDPYPDGEPVVK